MNDLFQGLWISGVGMVATVVICSAVIGMVWVMRLVWEGRPRPTEPAPAAELSEVPLPVVVAAAVAAVMQGLPYRVTRIQERNTEWDQAGRANLARTEGSFPAD